MNQNQLLTPDTFNYSKTSFVQTDVLESYQDRQERLKRLHSAMKLGNNHNHKVRLLVMNAEGENIEVKAKVWSVTEKYVILKNSIMIPISSIHEVRFM